MGNIKHDKIYLRLKYPLLNITNYVIIKAVQGVVRSKIGFVKVDGLGETLLFTRTKLTENRRVKNINFACFENTKFAVSSTRLLVTINGVDLPNERSYTDESVEKYAEMNASFPIGRHIAI